MKISYLKFPLTSVSLCYFFIFSDLLTEIYGNWDRLGPQLLLINTIELNNTIFFCIQKIFFNSFYFFKVSCFIFLPGQPICKGTQSSLFPTPTHVAIVHLLNFIFTPGLLSTRLASQVFLHFLNLPSCFSFFHFFFFFPWVLKWSLTIINPVSF